MRRRRFLALGVATFALQLGAAAQEAGSVRRIGFLGNSTEALEAELVDAFRQGLRDSATSKAATSPSSIAGPRVDTSVCRRSSRSSSDRRSDSS